MDGLSMTKKAAAQVAKSDSEQEHRRHVIKRLARTAARRALDKAFYEMIACSLTASIDASADMDDVRDSTEKMAQLLTKFG